MLDHMSHSCTILCFASPSLYLSPLLMLIGPTVRNTGKVILSKLENDNLVLKMFYCCLPKYCHKN